MGRYSSTKVCVKLSERALDTLNSLARKLGKSLEEVIEDILDGLSVSVSHDDVLVYLEFRDSLRLVKKLYDEVKEVKELLVRTSSPSPRTTNNLDLRITTLDQCKLFIDELASNGLLELVKKFLSGTDTPELYKLLNDDAFFMVKRCSEVILASNIPSKTNEVKRIDWII